jgi:hypothetical protein
VQHTSQGSAAADSGGGSAGLLGSSAGAPSTTPSSGPLAAAFTKNRKAEADKAMAAFFYANGISFNFARSPYLPKLLAAVAAHGPGYKAPSKYCSSIVQTTATCRLGAPLTVMGL